MRKQRLSRAIHKTAVKCIDGPWAGHTLYLSNYETAIVTFNGLTGQYRYGRWYAVS